MKKVLSVILTAAAVACLVGCGGAGEHGDQGKPSGRADETIVTFFNVGAVPQVLDSGSCAIIEDSGKLIVVDAGWNVAATQEKITQFLRKKQYTKIDHLILTHAHDDHCGGIPYLIDRFDVGSYYYKPCADYGVQNYDNAEKFNNNIVAQLQTKTNEDGSNPQIIVPSQEKTDYAVSETSAFTIYYRQDVFDGKPEMYTGDKIDYNAYSFGVRFKSKHTSVYIGGDAPNFLDEVLLDSVGHCQIMAAPHHGTTGPYSSAALIGEIAPKYTVIQGLNMNFGADTRERYVQSGTKIYTNEDYGSIIFTAKAGEVSVKTEKSPD